MKDENEGSRILKKYAVYGAFLGLICYLILNALSEKPIDITFNAVGGAVILGLFVGIMVAIIRIIGISVESEANSIGMKISVPIIFVCTFSFIMIGIIFGGIIGGFAGIVITFGCPFIGVIIGSAISALYYHEDVRKAIRIVIEDFKEILESDKGL